MARPRLAERSAPTPELLLEAAAGAFAASGYEGATLEDIASAAGIRRPSLLYHFRSKEALYAAVVERAFHELGQALGWAMLQPGGFAARLDALAACFGGFLATRPSFAPLMLREMLDGQGPGRDLLLRHLDPLLERLEAFVAAADDAVLPAGLSARGVILHLACGSLVRAASGPLSALWGGSDPLPVLARHLFLEAE